MILIAIFNLIISEHAEKCKDDTFYGDAMYHFFSGMLLEAWKSKTMAHSDRIAYTWAGAIFFATTWKYIRDNPAHRNSRKYGISWQTKDDFLYLGCTLILLINYFPLAYKNISLCL